jgi:hypothetical protein
MRNVTIYRNNEECPHLTHLIPVRFEKS